jgi:Calx-beta domain/FG-GAP-like repeat/FG-GAP repeat
MSLHRWLRNLRSALAPGHRHRGRRASHRAATHRPHLEVLEDRSVPAFLAPVDYAAGSYPIAVVTADFNGDGHLDLATANYSSNDVSVLLGNGDGTLQTARNYATGALPGCIAAGDFNGDGKLDLVTADGYYGDGQIRVLLGNGDGSFQWIGSSLSGGYGPLGLAVGDFNADGNLDVAVSTYFANWAGDNDYGAVVVLLGDGNGFFAGSDYLPISGYYAPSVVTADFNRDGYADLAWSAPWATPEAGAVEVFLSGGSGTFWAAPPLALDGAPWTVAVADLNGDGKPDLVTDSTSVLLGEGYGTFRIAQNYAGGGLVGDFNGDGNLDLLVGNNLLPGNGNDAGTFPAASGLGDFNGDARWDVAFVNFSANSVSVRLNDGIWDGPPTPLPPSLRIDDISVTEGNTGTRDATFTVTLSFASTEPVTVAYATADGSATAGSDYRAASGTLTFAPGETSKTITVLVNGDRLGEPNETFFVNLSSPTNAVIADGQGQGTIVDDEPYLSITPSVSRSEGNTGPTPFSFPITLSSAYDAPVTVDWATAAGSATDGSDYQAASGTLIFAPNETTKTITILVNGDRLPEPTETFFVNLSGATSAVIIRGNSVGTIFDDEPRVSINDVTVTEGHTGTRPGTFTVSLSGPYDVPVMIGYATANGTATADGDYQAASGTLTFAPGETSKTIAVLVNGDRLGEPDETFFVNLSNLNYGFILDAQGWGTIVDDEPRISIGDVSKREGNGKKTTLFTFTVTLSAAYDQPVTVSYSTMNGTATTGDGDYIARTGTLTFAPGEMTKTITIEVKGDGKREANESFYLDLFGLSGNALFTKKRGLGTILNDD